MLVFVEGHGIRGVLVNVDAVFPLLAKFEVLADCPLHHHVLAVASADTGDVALCVHDEHLQRQEIPLNTLEELHLKAKLKIHVKCTK